ncbi:MAG: hypothetical protein HYR84_09600 [Planctomycetes bacterium]|nr:hypothetical protein [Planctomycetota bacterium]
MLTAQTEELLSRLKVGTFDSADVQALENTGADDFVAGLDASYPMRFQERRLRDKWEVGVSSSLRFELVSLSPKRACFPILVLAPVFRNCLFVSSEAGFVTGLSWATRLSIRPVRQLFPGVIMTTGRGFKLDLTPDGWVLKAFEKQTVKLTDEFLQNRGWRFEAIERLKPRP